MIRLPRKSASTENSLYHSLGLKDLPFPTDPVVNPYSDDPRRNGTIYATAPVQDKINQFEQLLIRPGDFLNRIRLAYLWSKGDQQSGRGMGKTALLRYFRQRINKDWGDTEFNGQFSAVVVYVSFSSQVDRRYMEQLALSALIDICKSGVLDASRAALRYDNLTETQADVVLNYGAEADPGNLLNNDVLKACSIEPAKLDTAIAQRLIKEGVSAATATALARGTFEDHLRSFRRDGNLEPLYVPRDTRILDYSRTLLFNDVVHYLRAARFAGGYLFIDDIENLVDQMTRKDRIEFAKEFALCTVRPGYANTAYNFFSCVLTTHQQASYSLTQAWGEAGLAAIARLDPDATHSVELPLPRPDQAERIVVAHLDHYRADPADHGSIKPFTPDGMGELLRGRQLPRVLLSSAATVITHAAGLGIPLIDAAVVKAALESSLPPVKPSFTTGLDDVV